MKLCEIKSEINDAIFSLTNAVNRAEDVRDQCDREWREMNDLHAMLNSLKIQLEKVIPENVSDAIKGEEEENERLADQADAQSY